MPTFGRVAPSVYVREMGRAIGFYREGLGFVVDNVDDPPMRGVVTHGGAVLHLDVDGGKAGTSRVHMMVTEMEVVVERLRRAGVVLLQEPTVQPWGLREFMVADPDGNVLELAEVVKRAGEGHHFPSR